MNSTITGGRQITITFEPAADAVADAPLKTENVTVRQVRLRDYEAGLPLFQDEIALVAFLVGKPKQWVLGDEKTPGISPESYEEILKLGKEVNEAGFFSFCRRRIEAQTKHEMEIGAAVASLPAEMQELILQQGRKAATSSPASFSPPQPRRV